MTCSPRATMHLRALLCSIRRLPVKVGAHRMSCWATVLATVLACFLTGCMAKMTLPDGREYVGSTRAYSTYLERIALTYQASQDLHCAEDAIAARETGRRHWKVRGCGNVRDYVCRREEGAAHFEVVFTCNPAD